MMSCNIICQKILTNDKTGFATSRNNKRHKKTAPRYIAYFSSPSSFWCAFKKSIFKESMTIVVMQSHEQQQKLDKSWTKSDMDNILTKVGQAILSLTPNT